eukprot:6194517-Pleurochrysis_carterae.AAC.3
MPLLLPKRASVAPRPFCGRMVALAWFKLLSLPVHAATGMGLLENTTAFYNDQHALSPSDHVGTSSVLRLVQQEPVELPAFRAGVGTMVRQERSSSEKHFLEGQPREERAQLRLQGLDLTGTAPGMHANIHLDHNNDSTFSYAESRRSEHSLRPHSNHRGRRLSPSLTSQAKGSQSFAGSLWGDGDNGAHTRGPFYGDIEADGELERAIQLVSQNRELGYIFAYVSACGCLRISVSPPLSFSLSASLYVCLALRVCAYVRPVLLFLSACACEWDTFEPTRVRVRSQRVRTPPSSRARAPQLNQLHIDHILLLGFSASTCAALRPRGRIGCAHSTHLIASTRESASDEQGARTSTRRAPKRAEGPATHAL